MKIKRLSVYLLLLPFLSCAEPQGTQEGDIESRVNALLGQMTLQEKIGQMNQLSPFGGLEEMAGLIREGNVGSLLNLTDPELVNKAQRIAVEESRLGIPIIFGYDAIPLVDGKYHFDKIGDEMPEMTFAHTLYREMIPVILKVELKRGEQPTPFSKDIRRIRVVYGIDYMIQILTALGKDPLQRGYSYYSSGEDRSHVLSHLLKVSMPKPEETAQDLKQALKGTDITQKRLVELAMYAQQWLPMIEEYLEMPGFASTCYYFIAHTSEGFDDKVTSVIAKYTPLSPEELRDGAFDIHWFFEAYEKLGEKNFKMLYDAAKYSSGGTAHGRARKYADAALGKVDKETLQAEINAKRNKDLLMSIGLLPLPKTSKAREQEVKLGFLTKDGIVDSSGTVFPVNAEERIFIAHPYDLYSSGHWYEYQKLLFEKQIKQPFKQVFRELYVKLDEELDKHHSMLFSGNQIQPQKTVGALRSRRWVADYEDGLQKIYYKEDIIACIYAMADWFSPSDAEAPTLEYVVFSERRTGKPLKIKEIPDIIYSEVMRDVDLAVSVAHAGGVDPETSHSTIEMRRAIVECNLALFRTKNVRLEGNHAIIDGKLGQYTVHLGSGVVHQLGNAMLFVVPVHAQQRGRIFLPFVDDDPKTAEILSKILLFAEDAKIKDSKILGQIQ